MNRLMLLAGQTRREGWKTLDSKGSVDYLATIPPLPYQIRDQDWDAIELIHGIGQFYPWDAEELLKEIRAILKPDGVLILEQPDLCKAIKSGRVEWIFGDPTTKDPTHMVRWGYTIQSLFDLLRHKCGFRFVELRPAQHHVPARDFRIEARP